MVDEVGGLEDKGGRGGLEEDVLLYLIGWLFNFFFTPSLSLSPDLTCRTFASFKLAGRTQLQKRPGNQKHRSKLKSQNCCKFQSQRCAEGS